MNNGLSKILFFAAGAIVGSVATWKFVEEKYKRIADEEIESVKEHLRARAEELEFVDKDVEEEEVSHPEINETSIKEVKKATYVDYSAITRDLGYVPEPKEDEDNATEKQPGTSPYTIGQNDFDMNEDYIVDSMLYHADDYLTDEHNELIDNIEDSVGYECLNEFKESDTDVIYVRNDETKTDYEILKVDTNYKDLVDQEE